LKADIDYATSEAETTYGIIGVKVWVYKGDTLGRGADAPVAVVEPVTEEKKARRAPAKTTVRKPAVDSKPLVAAKPVVKRAPKVVDATSAEAQKSGE
jgi:small subunit ribosomal protein S3